jgi:hypothetical protein
MPGFLGAGDGNLLYPGHPTKIGGVSFIPIASIRMKHLRDGMEDNEYLHMLQARAQDGRAASMRLLNQVVHSAFNYTRDIRLWQSTRIQIAAAIESLADRAL